MALPFPDGPAHPGLGQGLHPTPHPKVKAAETAPVSTVKLTHSSDLRHSHNDKQILIKKVGKAISCQAGSRGGSLWTDTSLAVQPDTSHSADRPH